MLISKHRSRSVTFSIQTFKSTLLHCSSATMLVHTAGLPVFYGFIFVPSSLSILSCWYFISPAHSISHSRIAFSIDSYLLLLFLMLMFCLLFYALPSIPLAMVTSFSYIVYSNSVQLHLHSDFLRILNRFTHLFTTSRDCAFARARSRVQLTGAYNGNFVRVHK
jgi:hypothetical protein